MGRKETVSGSKTEGKGSWRGTQGFIQVVPKRLQTNFKGMARREEAEKPSRFKNARRGSIWPEACC